jgi:hypothetical protein
MGLDWVLDKAKARPGHEERYATVSRMLTQMREQGEAEPGEELLAEYEQVSISCYEVVGAPKIGEDDRATAWFKEHNYDPANADAKAGKLDHREEMRDFWLKPFDECLEKYKGKYVMELAEQQGGEAAVTGIAVASIDFRGKMMRYVEGLDEDLVNEAWEDHTAEECLAYAKKLEGVMPSIPDGPEGKELLQGAIDWLKFWGSRGFGYWAWY